MRGLIGRPGLRWAIFRLADVPILGIRDPHPIMFDRPDNRIESLHADDAGLPSPRWKPRGLGPGAVRGGGPSCQLTPGIRPAAGAMGVDPLPDNAFSQAEYATDTGRHG
jgi:hypothetical protein